MKLKGMSKCMEGKTYPKPTTKFRAIMGLGIMARFRLGGRTKEDKKFIADCMMKLDASSREEVQ